MPTDVTITYSGGVVSLTPSTANIKVQTEVTWTTPKDCGTTISFSNGCPFPDCDGGSYSSAGTPITTRPAQGPEGRREWPYTVVVTPTSKGTQPVSMDGVIVTENP